MEYFINGDEPKIVGCKCKGLYLSQMQENFNITDQSNVAFFNFSETWYRLYFEAGTIFWRKTDSISIDPVNQSLSSCLFILNLNELNGVIDHELLSLQYISNREVTGLEMSFSGGKTLKFSHFNLKDCTSVEFH